MAERGHFGDRLRSAWCLLLGRDQERGPGYHDRSWRNHRRTSVSSGSKGPDSESVAAAVSRRQESDPCQPITLRADPEELFVDAASGSSTIRWKYIERADQTTDHLFLFTSAMNAVVVPKAVPTTSTRSPTWRPSFAVMLRRLRTRTIKHPSDLAAGLSPDRFRRANNLRLRELSHS
jgi:YcxB-like protein